MKLHRLFIILAVMAAGFLCSCNQEPFTIEVKESQELMLSPELLDIQSARTKAISADDLKDDQFNENKISRLDVFIFKAADGTFVKDYHIGNLTPESIVISGGKEGYLLSRDWVKDRLEKNVPYKVYVVANSTNTAITTAGSITTEEALQALSTTDANIYKRYKEGVDVRDRTYSPNKTFLMNATVASWTIQSSATQLICENNAGVESPVMLERAAVKIVMEVELSPTLKARLAADHSQYGEARWKYVNFNTATPEIPEGSSVSNVGSLSGSYLDAVPAADIATNPGHYIVTTYAYPQTWTTATANDAAPAIVISYTVTDENGVPHYHYYYIPVCESTVTSTQRNKLYKVKAIISSYGSFETVSSEQMELTYKVMDWDVGGAAEVEANASEYLFVTPAKYVFNGGDEDQWLDNIFRYYCSGPVRITNVSATYKNYAGQTQTDPDASRWEVGAASNGQILVKSKVPTYGTFRTIKFTVEGGGSSEVVEIRHYPEDYVQGIASSWCSYDRDDWAGLGKSGTYMASGEHDNSLFFIQRIYSEGGFDALWNLIRRIIQAIFGSNVDDAFSARVFNPVTKHNHYIKLDGTRGEEVSTSTINNQMYVLQITSAGDKYSVGRPRLIPSTKNAMYYRNWVTPTNVVPAVTYYTSQDDVISPAFMLASQITILTNQFARADNAASHCALYKEVDQEGHPYTGWRLPTKQEINYMIENQQRDGQQAMIQVLTGSHYWALDGSLVRNTHQTGGNGNFVRCVRDVTEEELARLNQF